MVAGWALAQEPYLLPPDLTLRQAAAPHETLVVVIVAIVVGGAILFPSLALLFSLVLRGRFETPREDADVRRPASVAALLAPAAEGLRARLAFAGLLGGIGLLPIAPAPRAPGVVLACLVAATLLAFLPGDPTGLEARRDWPKWR